MDIGDCFLDGNADGVEFCPHDSYHNVLAACTYTLQEGEQPSRSGSISLFDVNADEGRFELFHRVETAGIFDMKWNPVVASNTSPLLAQADADGYLRIHRLDGCSDGSKDKGGFLSEVNEEKVSSAMCLCLDWNPSSTSISVGLSDGSVSIVSCTESRLEVVQEWKAHGFEVWTTTFDTHQPHLLYTGSDDCKFSCWDVRESPSNIVFTNSKVHTMGVCCIAKNPYDPYSVVTGSYDENMRVWDVRSISKPVNETSIGLGGGVWRIKYHPFLSGIVLAACMHKGFAVVKIGGEEGGVVQSYSKHGSLGYGADWQRGRVSSKQGDVVATCSFYDRLLRVWKPKM